MRDVYESDRRLSDPSQAVGKACARVQGEEGDGYTLWTFDDGTFLYARALNGWGDGGVMTFGATIDMSEARDLELVTGAEYAAWKAAYDASRAADREEAERETLRRLKKKFEG